MESDQAALCTAQEYMQESMSEQFRTILHIP